MTNSKLMREKLLTEKYQLLQKIKNIYLAKPEEATPEACILISEYNAKIESINEQLKLGESRYLRK